MLPFLALVMSIINLGLNFFLVDALQDRANMAARYVALNPSDTQGATTPVQISLIPSMRLLKAWHLPA